MLTPGHLFSLVLLISVAGCAERGRWVNPNIDETLWTRDQSYCRRDSERRAAAEQERELGRAEAIGGPGGRSTFRQDMIRYDATRYALKLYESCLRSRGYREVTNDR